MAIVYSVLCDTPAEAELALRRLCAAFGLEPSGPPMQVVGRDKWMGRARADDRTSEHGTAPAP